MQTEYKIIGGDGAEYGPATLDELESWIGDGRVAGSTQVWRNDLAHWSPAARYVKLQHALARLHAGIAPTPAAQSARAAGFWIRLGAYLMDRAILFMIFYGVLWNPLAQSRGWTMPVEPQQLSWPSWNLYFQQLSVVVGQIAPFLIGLTVLYDVLLNGAFGATLGKMAVGVRIVCADGSRLSYGRAFLRSMAGRLTEALLDWGYIWVAVRKDKRGMHDFIAGTKVVYLR
jgi:uncharacterized RDD family membrane protein YckC